MRLFLFVLFLINLSLAQESEKLISYVNPFVGSSNFGTTNPGPIAPRGNGKCESI